MKVLIKLDYRDHTVDSHVHGIDETRDDIPVVTISITAIVDEILARCHIIPEEAT